MPKRRPKRPIDLASATRIVATVGPAANRPEILKKMIEAGVDVFRFNMSHGSHEVHHSVLARTRRAAAEVGRPIGVLVDLQGPKIRTAKNEGEAPVLLRRGRPIRIGTRRGLSSPERIVIPYPRLLDLLGPGDRLLLDDGSLELRILGKDRLELEARVVRGGRLKERAGVNIPGRFTGVRVPTAKDRRDVRFAMEEGADFLALSFVQTGADMRRLRRLITRLQSEHGKEWRPAIIAKIEKPAALEHLDEILEESDGVMVARGDLGVEISLEKVPVWQKEILARARRAGVFTITATQMLESMVQNATPTRAEVSDVANAVFDGSDALMLSAESAVGSYPIGSVETLSRIANEADRSLREKRIDESRFLTSLQDLGGTPVIEPIHAMVRAAVELAHSSSASLIVAFTLTGRTGFLLAHERPQVPVLCLTPHEETRRKLCLAWNTRSLRLPLARNAEQMMRRGLEQVREAGLARRGDRVVLIGGATNLPGATNLLRLVEVGA